VPRRLFPALLAAATLGACTDTTNNRSAPEAGVDAGTDAEVEARTDAGVEASADVRIDASTDAGVDASTDVRIDASTDAGVDASAEIGATVDALADLGADLDAATEASVDAGTPVDAGADAGACDGPGARFITDVVAYQFGPGQSFGQDTFPANILGPPQGGGCCAGGVDVVSLGDGGSVTVAFAGNTIVDGPGPDFIVFENPFDLGGDPMDPYAEPGIVEVSQDGTTWAAYPCTATTFPYGTCAGWHPVFANAKTNTIDPTDPAVAGGDPFDLADVGLAWARYVRVTDRPGDGLVFDLDAIAIVNASCP
jgi:hypothetical protein